MNWTKPSIAPGKVGYRTPTACAPIGELMLGNPSYPLFRFALPLLAASALVACEGTERSPRSSPGNRPPVTATDAGTSTTADGGPRLDATVEPGDAGPNLAPTVSITSPSAGATVAGTVQVEIAAMDDRGVTSVELLVDGLTAGTALTAPFAIAWDTTGLLNGTVTLTARAADEAGLTAEHTIDVIVENLGMPGDQIPSINIIYPVHAGMVCGDISIEAAASDDMGVTQVEFFVDGASIGVDMSGPYTAAWTTGSVADGNHLVSAVATDTAGQRAQARIAVEVSNGAGACDNLPSVVIVAPTAEFVREATVEVRADASDDVGVVRVQFFVDNGLIAEDMLAPYSATWVASDFAEGPHTLKAIAYDTAGQSTPYTKQITIDRTAPSVSVSFPADTSLVNSSSFDVVAMVMDNHGVARVDVSLDGALLTSLTAAPFSLPVMNLAAGAHTVDLTASDRAGNEATATSSFTVDALPVVAITAPADGSFVRGSVSITANAADDVAVTSLELLVDSMSLGIQTAPPYAATWNASAMPDGVYTISAVATDSRGQSSTASIQVTVGDMPPTVTLIAPVDASNVIGVVAIEASASDDVGVTQVELQVDGITLDTDVAAPYAVDWDTAAAAAGNHTVSAIATDTRGQTTTAQITVNVNDQPPTVSITAPADGATVIGDVSITVAASDDLGVTGVAVSVDGALIGSESVPPFAFIWDATTAGNGPHTVSAVATDTRGQTTLATIMLTVADQPPTVTFTSPSNGATVIGDVSIALSAMDDLGVDSVAVSVDGAALGTLTAAPYALTWDASAAANGAHMISAVATDTRGQTTAAQISVTVADQPPTLSFRTPSNGATVAGTVAIGVNASDDLGIASVAVLVDSAPLATRTSPPFDFTWDSRTAGNGAHTIGAVATDTRGQTTTAQISVNVADQAPAVSWLAPTANADVSGTVTLRVSATDDLGVSRVDITDDGALLVSLQSAPYEYEWDVGGEPLGAHQLVATAVDTANQSASANRSVTVVDAPPTLSLTNPISGATVSGTVDVRVDASDDYGISSVGFIANGSPIGTVTQPPYQVSWNTCSDVDGAVALTIVATDTRGQNAIVNANVTVANGAGPPTLTGGAGYNGASVVSALAWAQACEPGRATGFVLFHSPSPGITVNSGVRVNLAAEARNYWHTSRILGVPTYYRVAAIEGGVTGQLSNEVAVVTNSVGEVEPNDSAGQAQSIQSATLVAASVSSDTDEDYFEVTVPEGGHVFAQVNDGSTGCSTDGELDLLDSSGAELGSKSYGGPFANPLSCPDISPVSDIWSSDLPAGTYRVRRDGAIAGTGSYSLLVGSGSGFCGNRIVETRLGESCDDGNYVDGDGCNSACIWTGSEESEPNGDVISADPVSQSVEPILGSISPAQDQDIYAVTVPLNGSIGVAFYERSRGSCRTLVRPRVEVLDTDGITVLAERDGSSTSASCPNMQPSSYAEIRALPAGTYYIRVSEVSGLAEIGNYLLIVQVFPPECGNRLIEPGEQCDDNNVINGDGCSSSCQYELEATIAPPGGTYTFSYPSGVRWRYYRIDLPSPGYSITGTVSDVGSPACSASAWFYLYDASGATLGIETGSGLGRQCAALLPGARDWATDLAAGSYYLGIYTPSAAPASHDLEIVLPAPECGNGIVEGSVNEQCDDGNQVSGDGCSATCVFETTATVMLPGGPTVVTGSIESIGDVDSYTVIVTSETYIAAEVFSPTVASGSCNVDTRLRLLAAGGGTIGSDDFDGVNSCSAFRPRYDTFTRLQPGSYVLSLEEDGNNALITQYQIELEGLAVDTCGNGVAETGEACDDGNTAVGDGCDASCQWDAGVVPEIEPNDGIGSATDSGLSGVGTVEIVGVLGTGGDHDYFSFTVPAGQSLTFDARTSGLIGAPGSCNGDTVIALRNSTGTQLTSDDDGGPNLCSHIVGYGPLGAGDYTVQVRAFSSNATFDYVMVMSLQ